MRRRSGRVACLDPLKTYPLVEGEIRPSGAGGAEPPATRRPDQLCVNPQRGAHASPMSCAPADRMIRCVMSRATRTFVATATSLAALGAATAQAFTGIPNTGPGADVVSGFGHVSAGPSLLGGLLAVPFDAAAADPVAAGALVSPATPEDDLRAALADMAGAATAIAADSARRRALDILEGNDSPALAKTAYHGIGLLNWQVKAQQVPAGGTVTIRQVRWGEHLVSDTWLLDFADPASAYSIRYEVVELGSAFGGELDPAPLLRDGTTAIGGQHSAIQPLAIDGNRDTGTTQSSRFTIARELGAVPEQSRSSVQAVTVAMPPPKLTSAILDPNLRSGHEAVATLKPATPEQITAARTAMGLPAGPATEADKLTAIGRLSDAAPEKQIWSQLRGLGDAPDATVDPAAADAYLNAAKAAGGATAELVSEMRTRTQLPAGIDPAGADVTVVLQNNEAYVSRTQLRLEPGAKLSVRVVNRDRLEHRVSALDLRDRKRILGATDWGEFGWSDVNLDLSPTLAPGEARTFTLDLAPRSFTLWVGDLGSGDQAGAAIAVDREVRQEALGFGAGTLPVHAAPAADGDVWVTLAGVDTIARVRPAATLAGSAVDLLPLPGGRRAIDSPAAPLAPSDATIDGNGIVWVTLASGNAIARIVPAQVQAGTSSGMTILELDACPADVCKPDVPPVPNEQPTRRPTRIKSYIDGRGNTVLWFVEAAASRIGAMRVTPDGTQLNQAHFECACRFPGSLDLGPEGSVWFTEVFENRIGRVVPDRTTPFSASAATVEHFNIPSAVAVEQPPLTAPVNTSLPLSLAVDGRNRVWFSQSSLSGAAYLNPAQAVPGTSSGFTEFHLPGSDFRSPAAPADVTVDRANSFWWVGEYGDQIEQRTSDGAQGVPAQGLRFRGSVRRGLTEGPVADAQGNLWVVESGGNVITRISGVTEGPLRPFGAPAGYEADTTADSVSGVRLRDTTSVDVRIVRAGAVVATATAPVTAGAFTVSRADWGAGDDQVRPDDVVRVISHGPFERAPLSFDVAKLSGAVRADGSLAGTALAGSQALSDRIAVTAAGTTSSAPINGGDGAWRIVPAGPLPQDAALSLSWSGATVAGTFRTVTSVAGAAPSPPAGDPAPGAPASGSLPAPPAGAAITATSAAPTTPTARDRACTAGHWLYGDARRPSVLLLGMTRPQVADCLGRPRATTAARGRRLERWTYARGLSLRFRAGRVVAFELRGSRLRTSRRRAGVGSSLAVLRRDLRGLRRDRRSGLQRALVRRADGRLADIRVRLDKSSRIRQIGVTLTSRGATAR